MSKNLLIVESPAKAKTIEKILGQDFQVRSCFGHIRDLEKAGMGIDVENGFQPRYIVPEDKKRVVRELKSVANNSDEVWLATDEDREGEAISWHLCEVLGLDPEHTKRIVFHEITKPAIESAVTNPRTVNMDLVMAQQARRVLDRIVGFELSPVLWRKISTSNKNLSAGRVQSVAVRLIVEREREINGFVPASSFKIEGLFTADDVSGRPVTFKAEGKKQNSPEDAEKFLQGCVGAEYTVADVRVKPGKRTPAAPFTTSTLQQEASRKLGYGVGKTMLIAQKLYENGHITYMRTDSVSLSDTAMSDIRKTVSEQYGERYHQTRKFKNKNESAQEAHEAIRPTSARATTVRDPEWQRLYELIWKRTMASQMADAELEKTTVNIEISTNKEELTASGEVIKFDGFLKVYQEDKDDDDQEESSEGLLPPMTVGQKLPLTELRATERFTRPPARYTEASLVKKLEELGIGRPSTYAPTISTIQKREYVEKREKEGTPRAFRILSLKDDVIRKTEGSENTGAEKGKLFPTDLGLLVTDFLKQYFDDIMDYGFTARIEEEFDEVADGKLKWNDMIDEFYGPFKKDVANTIENAERVKGERELGIDPESGKPVVARMARYGPIIQIGDASEEEKPRFAKLPAGKSIETITFEEALTLFKLQDALGTYEGKELSVNVGRFGPYVKWGDEFISIPRGTDLASVDSEKAIEYIKAKQEADAPVGEYDGKPIIKGKGRFGPFIKWDGLFINVPRRYDFDNLTQDEMNELIAAKVDKEANRYIQRWDDEKITIENARWGPVIKFGKKVINLPRKADGQRATAEDAARLSLEQVKEMIELQVPGAFAKKKAPAKKRSTSTGASRRT
jgi:DNA topoisomerase-1